MRFVAKSELARWPVVGRLIRGAGTLFIERGAQARHAPRQPSAARTRSRRGDVVAIFPEGTTTDGTSVLPFKSSLLQPIVEAQGHVQPVAIRYRDADGALSRARRRTSATRSFAASFWRVCGARALGRRAASRTGDAAARTRRTGASSRARPRPLSERLWLHRLRATAPGTRADRRAAPR